MRRVSKPSIIQGCPNNSPNVFQLRVTSFVTFYTVIFRTNPSFVSTDFGEKELLKKEVSKKKEKSCRLFQDKGGRRDDKVVGPTTK